MASIIKLEGIGKRYRIAGERARYQTLRDTLAEAIISPVRRIASIVARNGNSQGRTQDVWALKNVSVKVGEGEVVGIIGRNGAGKSTLLKIISRITEPTEGIGEVRGRVGSLLEVGTGIHPELTGRENIYLSGAILGMKRGEIERKFDEIVAFAEIGKFIDTPMKYYSTGMYMRLAFAVAAHLDTEILLVDEVLAVGDVRFQRKCLSKMEAVGSAGRTVLFISHNMPSITRLCQRAILLYEGRIVDDGPAHRVVSRYMTSSFGTSAVREWPETMRPGGHIVRLRAVRVRDEHGMVTDVVDIRRPLNVEMEYEVLEPGYMLMPNFQFRNGEGLHLFGTHDLDPQWRRCPRPAGTYVSVARVPGNLLAEGTLFVGAGMATLDPLSMEFYELDVVAFEVVDSMDGDSARGDYGGVMRGIVRPLLDWRTEFEPRLEGVERT